MGRVDRRALVTESRIVGIVDGAPADQIGHLYAAVTSDPANISAEITNRYGERVKVERAPEEPDPDRT